MACKSDPLIGQHCSVVECKCLDFLPFICIWCKNIFCLEHRFYSSHECPKYVDQTTDEIVVKSCRPAPTSPCHVTGCHGNMVSSLPTVTCPHCSNIYCMKHRLCADHACPNDPTLPRQKAELSEHAKELLNTARESIEQVQHKRSSKPGSSDKQRGGKSSALARKVLVMKLKQRAVGERGVPSGERVYLDVTLPVSDQRSVAVYVSSKWTVGKCIDNIAALTSTTNTNATPNAKKLRIFRASDGCMFPCDATVASLMSQAEEVMGSGAVDQQQDAVMVDGQSMILEYV